MSGNICLAQLFLGYLHPMKFRIVYIKSLTNIPPTGTDVKEAQVICVSTGTKCINGEYMSDRGLALNDCHAEIIARRSLIRYLYTQLEFFLRSVSLPHQKTIKSIIFFTYSSSLFTLLTVFVVIATIKRSSRSLYL